MASWRDIGESIQRINNISQTGVGWNPPEPHRQVVRSLMKMLNNRQVLYVRAEYEFPDKCYNSVQQIRDHLDKELQALRTDGKVAGFLEIMQKACREFVETMNRNRLNVPLGKLKFPAQQWQFIDALARLRGEFGYCLAYLSAIYQIDVGKNLMEITPNAIWGRILDQFNISRS